jgi:hypothetical protein
MELNLSIAAPTNRTYQWRIFRGDCATTVTAANNNDPNGLLLFATIQSYPDVATGTGTTASLTREIAGSLDSVRTYSIRFRTSQSATNWNGTSPIAVETRSAFPVTGRRCGRSSRRNRRGRPWTPGDEPLAGAHGCTVRVLGCCWWC